MVKLSVDNFQYKPKIHIPFVNKLFTDFFRFLIPSFHPEFRFRFSVPKKKIFFLVGKNEKIMGQWQKRIFLAKTNFFLLLLGNQETRKRCILLGNDVFCQETMCFARKPTFLPTFSTNFFCQFQTFLPTFFAIFKNSYQHSLPKQEIEQKKNILEGKEKSKF